MKHLDKQLFNIVIFGRTNVGKSTLFNRLVEKNQALVSGIAGTTRDSNFGTVAWQNAEFNLIDTGGFMDLNYLSDKKMSAETIDEFVQKQARQFVTKADLVLFLVDSQAGLLTEDKQIALIIKKILPKTEKVILVANKLDNYKLAANTAEFYELGLGEPKLISATTGAGTGDLLDYVVERLNALPEKTPSEKQYGLHESSPLSNVRLDNENVLKICILGKPNVGKSSLLNAILGYDRVIVSPIAHTTREPQDTDIIYKEKVIKLIDTAGISKKGLKTNGLEKYGIMKTLSILNKADIALLVLDINEEVTHQDITLIADILDRQKSLIIVANKWDLIDERDTKKYTQYIHGKVPFAKFAPIQFISAKSSLKVDKILDLILNIYDRRHMTISDSQADKFMKHIVKLHRPTKGRGTKYPRLHEFKQIDSNPPKFLVRVGANESLAESYLHFMKNRLREKFDLVGTPIMIQVIKKREDTDLDGTIIEPTEE